MVMLTNITNLPNWVPKGAPLYFFSFSLASMLLEMRISTKKNHMGY